MVNIAVFDGDNANQELIRELGLLEPKLRLSVFGKMPEPAGFDGLLIMGATNFEAMGKPDAEKARTIVDVIKDWGYLAVLDMGMKFPRTSNRVDTGEATLSILSPRDPGFADEGWPKKILRDLQQTFGEQLLGRRRE